MRIILCANHPLCESSTGIMRIVCQKTTIARIILCANHPLRESSCYLRYPVTLSGMGTGSYSDTPYSDSSYSDYAVHTLRVHIFWPNAHIAYFSRISPLCAHISRIFLHIFAHCWRIFGHIPNIFRTYFLLVHSAYLGNSYAIFRLP